MLQEAKIEMVEKLLTVSRAAAMSVRTATAAFVAIVMVLSAYAAPCGGQEGASYTKIQLLPRGSRANMIADDGRIVGPTSTNDAFVMSGISGELRVLPRLPAYAAYLHTARATNALGEVVGMAQTDGSGNRGISWTSEGPVELVPLAGYSNSGAMDINDAGIVVGNCNVGPDGLIAVRWVGHVPELLISLADGDYNAARAINADGIIVGESRNADGLLRAVRWSEAGDIEELGVLPGDQQSRAYDINDSGDVVGASWTESQTRAVLWRDGDVIDLSPMVAARAISNSGLVVGYAHVDVDSIWDQAALWHMGEVSLLPSTAERSYALDVDEQGVIVGSEDVTAVAWLMVPIPTPVSSVGRVKSRY